MTPAERRTALLRLLAAIDQQIAECEALAAQPVLAYDEEEFVALHLHAGRIARERVETMIEGLGDSHRAP